jgi:hypothetical protein
MDREEIHPEAAEGVLENQIPPNERDERKLILEIVNSWQLGGDSGRLAQRRNQRHDQTLYPRLASRPSRPGGRSLVPRPRRTLSRPIGAADPFHSGIDEAERHEPLDILARRYPMQPAG